MSSQAAVQSIEMLKELRAALAIFADEAMGALGGVDMEVRRTGNWLHNDRPVYWADQIKRRREAVTSARAEVARRKMAKTADYTPAMSEQKELLRKAEASLQDAEVRVGLVKKWQTGYQQSVLEYHGGTRRIKDLASGDVPRAMALLERMIEALEAYTRIAVPTMDAGGRSPLETVAEQLLEQDAAAATEQAADPEDAPTPPASSSDPEPESPPI